MSTELRYKYKKGGYSFDSSDIQALSNRPDGIANLGISFSDKFLAASHGSGSGIALDAGIIQPVITPSGGTPVQFLQEILSGTVHILTVVRKADEVSPVVVAGQWHYEEIALKTMEHTGTPQLYSDHGGLPLGSFHEDYQRRQVIRLEMGIEHTPLADARSSATGTSPQNEKRTALANAFEIIRNDIAFNGFNFGTGKTYGILNDPNLPAYIDVALGAGGDTLWSTKTTVEVINDLSSAYKALEIQAGGNVDPTKDAIDLCIPLAFNHYLTKADGSFSNGKTAMEWLKDNYPSTTVVTVPQFAGADAGENVFYLKAISVDNSGTDGGESMIQVVPAKMRATGSVLNAKGGVTEGYTSACAGTFVKRAYSVTRYSGI